ncbi:MAG: hypothetical protein K0S29_322 [Gammaproteobacteria bacterium]|jgi:hypothetical protein|nr:hypothetical protein [Gammaproteobacteria bacterium]
MKTNFKQQNKLNVAMTSAAVCRLVFAVQASHHHFHLA